MVFRVRNFALSMLIIVLLCVRLSVVAQDAVSCPAIVREAVDLVSDRCEATGRNQVCYGNVTIEVEPHLSTLALVFHEPGDISDVAKMRSLSLSGLDESVPEWGIAVMKLQANLPDTLPGQNVTVVLFGDVTIEDAIIPTLPIMPLHTLEVIAQTTINVRSGPSTEHTIVGTLQTGTTVVANARNEDQQWLHIILGDGQYGWVHAPLVEVKGFDHPGRLPLIGNDGTWVHETDPESEYTHNPMQAFYFRSGVGDSACTEAPESGILIQSLQGGNPVRLYINEVRIILGSTLFLQAQPGSDMIVKVLEGSALIEAFGERVAIPAGMQARTPLDDEGLASDPPSAPEPITDPGPLPIDLLDRPVEIPPPVSLDAFSVSLGSNAPQPGRWRLTWDYIEESEEFPFLGTPEPEIFEMIVLEEGRSFELWFEDRDTIFARFDAQIPGVYAVSGSAIIAEVVAPDLIRGEQEFFWYDEDYYPSGQEREPGSWEWWGTSSWDSVIPATEGLGFYHYVHPFTLELVGTE